MRIGVVCEGEKTDKVVLDILLSHLFPQTSFYIRGLTKADIFREPMTYLADVLNQENIRHALMLWDLHPPGLAMAVKSQRRDKPSRSEQRQTLLSILCNTPAQPEVQKAGVIYQQAHCLAQRYRFDFADPTIVHPNSGVDVFSLTCVCYMLEGWFLADPILLRELASTNSHKASPFPNEKPEVCKAPGVVLTRYFGRAPNSTFRYFNKMKHNKLLIEAYIREDKVDKMLKESTSLRRIYDQLKAWGAT